MEKQSITPERETDTQQPGGWRRAAGALIVAVAAMLILYEFVILSIFPPAPKQQNDVETLDFGIDRSRQKTDTGDGEKCCPR